MNTNGIGLGLVISEHIVNMFDGLIDFDSTPEIGSTFIFTIKLSSIEQISNVEHIAISKYQLNSSKLVFEW